MYHCQTSTGWYLHSDCKFPRLVSHWQQAAPLAVFFDSLSNNFLKTCLLSTIFCDAFCISVCVFSACIYQCQTSTGWYLHTVCKFAHLVSHWQQAASLAVFFDNLSDNFFKTCLLSTFFAMLSAYLSPFFQCVHTSVRLPLGGTGTCILIVNLLVPLVTDNKLHH